MQIPGNMRAPKLKLNPDEVVEETHDGLRKKGIFGNLYGALYVTNQRVAFAKAVMKGGIATALNMKGVKAKVEFDRAAISSIEKTRKKKLVLLSVSEGERTEHFALAEDAIDSILAKLTG